LGSFAEYLALPRADRNLVILPDAVSFVQAAALGVGLRRLIGPCCNKEDCEQKKWSQSLDVEDWGCRVSCLRRRRVLCKSWRLTCRKRRWKKRALWVQRMSFLLQTKPNQTKPTQPNEQVRSQVLEITNGGADLSVDAAGFPEAIENAIHSTCPTGRMV